MNEVVMLTKQQQDEPLRNAIQRQTPAILTYQSRGKWRVAKITVSNMDENSVTVACMKVSSRPQPINISPGHAVGISFKLPSGKCVFDSRVLALQAPESEQSAGDIVVAMPENIEIVQRRSYFRVNVPRSMKVDVVLWHRRMNDRRQQKPCQYYHGQLTDISAGGAQLSLANTDSPTAPNAPAQKPDVHIGQFIEMRFTPLQDEPPILLTAQIRNAWPSTDKSELYLGLQIVGLEASAEGHETLAKLASIVDRYHTINQRP